ncbi:GGDEF domain-containing protein [Kutzneria albida]|uniref:GGDEF domain-containing protein n=1 Tax=Kutzneria albida TaxID=43357 RepID=UPI000694177F|nr:GGDEF domain-containing protein [Kutzneria albida]
MSVISLCRRLSPRRWSIWSLPRHVLAFVLVTDLLAIALTVSCTVLIPVNGTDWLRFAALVVGVVAHLEAARGIERTREVSVEGSPYTNLNSLWMFAGLLVLPFPLVVALVVINYLHLCTRIWSGVIVYRKVFTVATMVLAGGAALAVLIACGLTGTPRVPTGFWSLLAVIAAAACWWLVNYALVVGAILLSNPELAARKALGEPADQIVVLAGLGLGLVVACLLISFPWVVPVVMLTIVALHREFLLPQFQRAARTDAKTGLASPTFWAQLVSAELTRARLTNSSVGLLMLDIDHFAEVNNTYGHLAGDAALEAVVRAVRHEVRHDDLVARWGGDELAVMMPGAHAEELLKAAERIRLRLAQTEVSAADATSGRVVEIKALTVSVGAAVYPESGTDVDGLVVAADGALLAAKAAGRNQVRLAMPGGPGIPISN